MRRTHDSIMMGPEIPIDDPDDPRIAVFRNIRERDLVGRSGFIAEGAVVLDLLLVSQRFRPTALLILRNRLDGLRERLGRLDRSVPVYTVERDCFDAIAGFPVHRGILAHGEAVAELPGASTLLAQAIGARRPVVVAVGIANHDNLGALFRNAAAFGVGAVLLDRTSCHPLYRKALRVSVGSVLTLPWTRGGTAGDLLDAVLGAGFRPLALSPAGEDVVAALATTTDPRPVALFVGAEGPGLPIDLMDRMEVTRIEMAAGLDSLNVATSAAIVLHRLYQQRSDAP